MVVVSVLKGGPAETAPRADSPMAIKGLRAGDEIMSVQVNAGKPARVQDIKSLDAALAKMKPGDTVRISVVRSYGGCAQGDTFLVTASKGL